MRRIILISPFSAKLMNGVENPKNYPHWKAVVKGLINNGCYTIQIGVYGEEDLGCNAKVFNAPLPFLLDLAKLSSTWASVDNFFPHLCQHGAKPGVVIWGQSDPKTFGYPSNVNLVKDQKYLRPGPQQFWLWTQTTFNPDAFVSPEEVIEAILKQAS